jgi:membrane fusion protein (multidrug efflux system)
MPFIKVQRAGLAGLALWAVAAHAADAPIRVLLAPELETRLVSQMNGEVASVKATLGAPVRQGQLLVSMVCDEAQARVAMAKAEAAGAKESLDVKTSMRKLNAAGDMEVNLARANLDKATGGARLAAAQAAYCRINAPFDGRIVNVGVKPHQGTTVGTPLIEMVSDGPLKLRLNVPSTYLRTLKPNAPFKVAIDETGKTYDAHVTAINARVDAVAQTVELEAHMDVASPELLAGMSGTATFPAVR